MTDPAGNAELIARLRRQAEYARTHAMPSTSRLHTEAADRLDAANARADQWQKAWQEAAEKETAAKARLATVERELAVLTAEHEKVLSALPPRYLDPVADGGGAWHYVLIDKATEARIAKFIGALEFFADDANWRMNGPLDPSGINFIGRIHARAALQSGEKPE